MKHLKQFHVFIVTIVMAYAAQASDELKFGLKVGDQVPSAFVATNQHGIMLEYKELTGDKGLIVLFNRSADWCGYCKKQMKDWDTEAHWFKEKGYEVAAITYDSVEKLKRFAKQADISYELLSDADSKIIRAFGLLNTNFEPDSRFYGIPHPAIYVVSPEGKVTNRFSIKGYTKRPPIGAVYQALFGTLMPE